MIMWMIHPSVTEYVMPRTLSVDEYPHVFSDQGGIANLCAGIFGMVRNKASKIPTFPQSGQNPSLLVLLVANCKSPENLRQFLGSSSR